jgi:Zn-dependent protease with chaperone function
MHASVRILFLSVVLFCFCAGPWAPAGEPLTLTTIEQENELGDKAYKEILQKERLCQDKELVAFVQRVGKRVCDAAPDKGFKYEISVLESPIVNAFCLPGGKICVYTGILPYCQDEAGLATVMSHEVAHATLRHGGQRMTQGTVVDMIGGGLAKVLEQQGVSGTTEKVALGAYGYGTQLGILLPYSRSHETEADKAGLRYLAKAGYDPKAAPEFWKRFGDQKSSMPTFFSTHPSHEGRAQRLDEEMVRALRVYEKSPKLGLGERLPAKYLAMPKAVESGTPAQPKSGDAPATVESKPRKDKPDSGKASGVLGGIESLANDEIRKGLQAALAKGFRSAIATLGKADGFFGDELVKIAMPEKLVNLEKAVRALGKGKTADEFILQMNRAAEKAVPETTDILAEAIAGLTLDDARGILKGKSDEATQYFKRTCNDSLQAKILPIVKDATDKVGATGAYKDMLKKGGFAAKLLVGDFDLDRYVTSQAVAGMFVKIADEEKRIRENPASRSTDILRKVFGALGK